MAHTKRSEEFKARLERLIRDLEAHDESTRNTVTPTAAIRDAIQILLNNTTDCACIVKAAEDEPIFPLRGSDFTADGPVDVWCELQLERTFKSDEAATRHLTEKIYDARECAREMRAYPNRKMPD